MKLRKFKWNLDKKTLPIRLCNFHIFKINNNIFILGGETISKIDIEDDIDYEINNNLIFKSSINKDGTIEEFISTDIKLPIGLAYVKPLVINNVLYIFGHDIESDSIKLYVFNEHDFILVNKNLPNIDFTNNIHFVNNKVYILGGRKGSDYINDIYVAPVDKEGNIGEFSLHNVSIPSDIKRFNSVVAKNKIYLLNYYYKDNTNNKEYNSKLYVADILYKTNIDNNSIDTDIIDKFKVIDDLILPENYCAGVNIKIIDNNFYLIGGIAVRNNRKVNIKNVYRGDIYPNGAIAYYLKVIDDDLLAFDEDINLPESLSYTAVLTTNNKVYLLGGYTDNGITDKIYVAGLK